LVKKLIFHQVIGIVSIDSKLLKTVGLLTIRLDFAKLRLKNWKEKSHFWIKSETRIFYKNLNPIFCSKNAVFRLL